jgi:hypothetical protein
MQLDRKDLKIGFDKMLGIDTQIKRKQKSIQTQKKNAFISIIQKYDEALTRSVILHSNFSIDLTDYEDPYYSIIDDLILLSWGPDIYSLIEFYFYGRIGEDGIENFIEDENGNEIYVRTPEDLYLLIEKLYPNII